MPVQCGVLLVLLLAVQLQQFSAYKNPINKLNTLPHSLTHSLTRSLPLRTQAYAQAQARSPPAPARSPDADLLLRALKGQRVERPPVWLMRQVRTTALLHYCTTELLHYCTTALHHCTTPLHYTIALHHCTTPLYYTTPLHCTTPLHYTTVLHHCTTPHHCTALHHTTTPLYCTTALHCTALHCTALHCTECMILSHTSSMLHSYSCTRASTLICFLFFPQAGRYMKDFRKFSDKYSFRERSETPAMAVELSLQPWRAFGTDAVIMFSDILTPLPAMGVDFEIVPGI
jgi:hypothetical protein